MDVVRPDVILTLDRGLGDLGGNGSVSVGFLKLDAFSSGTGSSLFTSDILNEQESSSGGKGYLKESESC